MCLSPESVPHVSLFSDKHPSREWCHRHVPCIQSPPTEVKFRYTCPFLSPGLRTLLFFLAPVPLAATLSPFTTCHGQRDRRGLHVRSASNNTRGGGWGGGAQGTSELAEGKPSLDGELLRHQRIETSNWLFFSE